MRVPKAPSWNVVFLFGGFWNAVVEQSWIGVAICAGIWLFLALLCLTVDGSLETLGFRKPSGRR